MATMMAEKAEVVVSTERKVPRRLMLVDVDQIRGNPYNPSSRTQGPALKRLLTSISKVGLLVPVLLSNDYMLTEGHRRWTCVKILGWKKIEGLVETVLNSALVYAEANSTQRPVNGAESLSVYLDEPRAVTDSQRRVFLKMEAVIGRDMMEEARKAHLSASIFTTAQRLSRICDERNDEFIRKAFSWLLTKGNIGQTLKMLEVFGAGDVFYKAIMENKEVASQLYIVD